MFDHVFTGTDLAIALAAFLMLWYVVGCGSTGGGQ
jgi:hypothetical protein